MNFLNFFSLGHFGNPEVKIGQWWALESYFISREKEDCYIVDGVENDFVIWHYGFDYNKKKFATKKNWFVYTRVLVKDV